MSNQSAVNPSEFVPPYRLILGLVVGSLILVFMTYRYADDLFSFAPASCYDLTVNQMNDIYKNSLLGRSGLEILDTISVRDAGSVGDNLRCKAHVMTNRGEMQFLYTTKEVNGTTYMELRPSF